MKQAFSFLLLLLALSCGDQSRLPLPSIEGRWRQLIPENPPRTYEFRNGVVTQSTLVGSQVVAWLQFVYSEQVDTIRIGGDPNNLPRTWIVRYIGDCAMEANQLPQSTPGLGQHFIFERL